MLCRTTVYGRPPLYPCQMLGTIRTVTKHLHDPQAKLGRRGSLKEGVHLCYSLSSTFLRCIPAVRFHPPVYVNKVTMPVESPTTADVHNPYAPWRLPVLVPLWIVQLLVPVTYLIAIPVVVNTVPPYYHPPPPGVDIRWVPRQTSLPACDV